MGMMLGIVIERRSTGCGSWEVIPADDLLMHRQFVRLALASVAT